MPAYNENGDYVLEDGSVIPARFAQAAGFGMELQPPQPVIDPLTLPNPEPAPPHLAGMLPQAPAPSPEYTRAEPPPGLAFQPEVPQQVEPVATPVAQPTDGLPALEQAPYDDRVQRTAGMYGSHPGRQQLRAEYTESGADLLQNSADKKLESDMGGLTVEAEKMAALETYANAGAQFAGEVARDLDARQDQIRQRSAQLREELDSFELDPNRVFRKQGNWANVADTIAVAFGALAQYSTGRNVALDLIRKKVEDDMTSQDMRQKQLVNQYNRLPDEIQAARQFYDNEVAADAVERAFKFQAIEAEMRKKLVEVQGRPAAEAAYMEALAKVVMWKNENLDRAEKAALTAEAQAIQLQVAAMKKQGGGGKKQKFTTASPYEPRYGSFVKKDGTAFAGDELDSYVDKMQPAARTEFQTAKQVAEMTHDYYKSIEAIANDPKWEGMDPKLLGPAKAAAMQEHALVLLDALKAIKGAASENDRAIVERAIGGIPTDVKALLKGSGEDAVRRARSYAESKERGANRFLPPGVTWGGAQRDATANPYSSPAPEVSADDARAQLVVDAASGDVSALSKLGDVGGMGDAGTQTLQQQLDAVEKGSNVHRAKLAEFFGGVPAEHELNAAKMPPEVKAQARRSLQAVQAFDAKAIKLREQMGKRPRKQQYRQGPPLDTSKPIPIPKVEPVAAPDPMKQWLGTLGPK